VVYQRSDDDLKDSRTSASIASKYLVTESHRIPPESLITSTAVMRVARPDGCYVERTNVLLQSVYIPGLPSRSRQLAARQTLSIGSLPLLTLL
jgi:hypothetical protein